MNDFKDPKALSDKIIQGDRRALSKAITLIESKKAEDRELSSKVLENCLPHSGKSLRIGISGIPGVGKSSFIEVLGLSLIEKGHKVGVLAVDPSSPLSGGSILGDKTRMEELSQNESAYIRPSPTTGAIGGVAAKTRESIFLCEAAGYDVIIVETVGVGQSEYQVSSMVDLFLMLMVPNAGDELQGIKKGIMELADLVIINKADGDTIALAENAKVQYQNALEIIKRDRFWNPKVTTCSSKEKKGFGEVIALIEKFQSLALEDNYLQDNRKKQTRSWLDQLLQEHLKAYIKQKSQLNQKVKNIERSVFENRLSAYEGAKQIIKSLFNS